MNVLLIDSDSDFRRRFSASMAASLNDIVFTSVADISESDLTEGPGGAVDADVILVDSESDAVEELKKAGLADRTVIFLRDDSGMPSVRSDGVRCVYKYQRVSSIVSLVSELADATFVTPALRAAGRMEVLCVTGFSGGCGRTSFSVMLARLMHRMHDKSVVILPVEKLSDINDYFPHSGIKSDINLMLLNFASGMKIAPQRFTGRDSCGVNAFIMPDRGGSDITDLSRADVGRLISMIAGWEMFDGLILDLSPQAGTAAGEFMRMSDRIFVLHDSRRSSRHSERLWQEHALADVETRTVHVDNMVADGHGSGDIFIDEEREKDTAATRGMVSIPYDPDSFFSRDGAADISMVGEFSRFVAGIVERI